MPSSPNGGLSRVSIFLFSLSILAERKNNAAGPVPKAIRRICSIYHDGSSSAVDRMAEKHMLGIFQHEQAFDPLFAYRGFGAG